MLFIVAGAFAGLTKTASQRAGKRPRLSCRGSFQGQIDTTDHLLDVMPEDLTFGLDPNSSAARRWSPRSPTWTKTLVKILSEPKNALSAAHPAVRRWMAWS